MPSARSSQGLRGLAAERPECPVKPHPGGVLAGYRAFLLWHHFVCEFAHYDIAYFIAFLRCVQHGVS
jgi:hypothetical protein